VLFRSLDEAREGALEDLWKAFRKRLRELGYIEGKNTVFEARYAKGATDRLPALAGELVALKPDLIATEGTGATRAVTSQTSQIPIVFLSAADPVGNGLVVSLSRPGGNVTGLASLSTVILQKNVELLHEVAPTVQRIAVLTDLSNPNTSNLYSRTQEQAEKLKVVARLLDGATRAALDRSFETIRRERIQGFLVSAAAPLLDHRDAIVQFAAREKLPAIYGRLEYVRSGGLLVDGVGRSVFARRGAEIADRILRGAKPASIPVEQARSLRMVVNMKTARAMGLEIPEAIRLRADEVIE